MKKLKLLSVFVIILIVIFYQFSFIKTTKFNHKSSFKLKPTIEIKIIEPEMVFIKGGKFNMGCNLNDLDECYDWNTPVHSVELSDFLFSKYEITQEIYESVMHNNPSYNKGPKYPVENISYEDAVIFILTLNNLTGKNYRFPTEAEWEYVAEGGGETSKHYHYSGSNKLYEVAWFDSNSNHQTHPVGLLKPNELGIYDLAGNVWEFCYDWFGDYDVKTRLNPRGPFLGTLKVMRGGSFELDNEHCWDNDFRVGVPTYEKSPDLGLRLVIGIED